jgi:hypothetical protein
MSAFDNILGAIGGIGNAAGVQGSGPGGLNMLQRAALTPQQSATYTQQSALSQLATDPNFQGLAPADQQAQVLKITGDPAVAQKVSALSQLAKINMNNPRQAIQQGVQTGNLPVETGINTSMNPMMMMGQPSQPSITASNLPPIPGTSPQGQATSPSSPPNGTQPVSPDDKRDYKYLASLPPAMQGLVKGISEGDEQALNLASRSPMAIPLMSAVTQFDPSYSATNFTARNDMAQSIGKGKIYDFNNAANKAVQHSAQLLVAHNEQGNTDYPAVNAVTNLVDRGGGGSGQTNFNSVKSTFVPEMAKFTSGVGGSSDADRKELNDNFTPNMSDQQLTGALAKKVGMGVDAVNSTEQNIRNVMGHTIPILTPENRSLAGDIQNYSSLVGSGKKESPEAQAVYSRIKNAASTVPQAAAPSQPSAPTAQISKEDAIAELRRRGKIQ